MMLGRVMTLGAVFLMLGGGTWPWQDIEQDYANCRYEAYQKNKTDQSEISLYADACLRAKGYTQSQTSCMWATTTDADRETCLRNADAPADTCAAGSQHKTKNGV